MNELNNQLDSDLNLLSQLKGDLEGVENLIEEHPVDPSNIIASMEQREHQMEKL